MLVPPHLKSISALGFGAMIGAGVLGLMQITFSPFATDLPTVLAIGALIGAGVHLAIAAAAKLVVPFAGFCLSVCFLYLSAEFGLMPKGKSKQLIQQRIEEFFGRKS